MSVFAGDFIGRCNIICNICVQKNAKKSLPHCGTFCAIVLSCQSRKGAEMKNQDKKTMGVIMDKALKSRVTQQVREDICSVLDVNCDRMTAKQAIAYAQIAKAIKGDKSAFEAISGMDVEIHQQDRPFFVEIKVVE